MLLKKLFAFILICFASSFAFATGPTATVQWEIRTTGNDANGGGFDAFVASPGTDFSQQDAAQVAYTDLVIGGTNTQLTSVAHAFSSTSPGNLLHITGGTGFTTGWYECISQAAGVCTMDRAVGTAASTGGTGNLGGGLLTLAGFNTAYSSSTGSNATGNIVWVKSGTYTISSAYTPPGSSTSIGYYGYQTSHGDNTGTRPLITTATNSIKLIQPGSGTERFKNINYSNTAATRGFGFFCSGGADFAIIDSTMDGFSNAINCTVSNNPAASFHMANTEIKNSTVGAVVLNWQMGVEVFDSYIHANTGTAFDFSGGQISTRGLHMMNVIMANNTGHCIYDPSSSPQEFTQVVLKNIVCYGATGDGIDLSGIGSTSNASPFSIVHIENVVVWGASTFGFRGPNVTATASTYMNSGVGEFRNNATGSNTSGATVNWFTMTGTQTPTVDPFTNASGGDFSLNTNASGGALLKAAGMPGLYPGGTSTGYSSIGAVEPNPTSTTGASNYAAPN